MLVIDGSYSEGGGQILRTSLALAAILARPIRIKKIRAGRKNPGLAAQHLTSVRAVAKLCDAILTGDQIGSTQLTFKPQRPPVAGLYEFDVTEAREGGSAGAVTLVLQTVLLPLAMAAGPSTVIIKGGTHVAWSPSFHYVHDVYLPMLAYLDVQATAEILAWGWYPVGQGEIKLEISGSAFTQLGPAPIQWLERGALKQVKGITVASSLPSHIAQRMSDRLVKLLHQAGLPTAITPLRVQSASPGAGIFLMAEYEQSRAGFGILGEKGKPSEQVAEEAAEAVLAFDHSQAFVDEHLADQLILPIALSGRPVTFLTSALSRHTLTNIWTVEQFLGPMATVNHQDNIIQFSGRTDRI
jgi:RNA 3'-terminal phosphate cyclase (ATP)